MIILKVIWTQFFKEYRAHVYQKTKRPTYLWNDFLWLQSRLKWRLQPQREVYHKTACVYNKGSFSNTSTLSLLQTNRAVSPKRKLHDLQKRWIHVVIWKRLLRMYCSTLLMATYSIKFAISKVLKNRDRPEYPDIASSIVCVNSTRIITNSGPIVFQQKSILHFE